MSTWEFPQPHASDCCKLVCDCTLSKTFNERDRALHSSKAVGWKQQWPTYLLAYHFVIIVSSTNYRPFCCMSHWCLWWALWSVNGIVAWGDARLQARLREVSYKMQVKEKQWQTPARSLCLQEIWIRFEQFLKRTARCSWLYGWCCDGHRGGWCGGRN